MTDNARLFLDGFVKGAAQAGLLGGLVVAGLGIRQPNILLVVGGFIYAAMGVMILRKELKRLFAFFLRPFVRRELRAPIAALDPHPEVQLEFVLSIFYNHTADEYRAVLDSKLDQQRKPIASRTLEGVFDLARSSAIAKAHRLDKGEGVDEVSRIIVPPQFQSNGR